MAVKGLGPNAEKAWGRVTMTGLIGACVKVSIVRVVKKVWVREDTRVLDRVEGKGWRLVGRKR